MKKIAAVGAAIEGGFNHTSELIPIKFKEAMASPDQENWIKSVDQWKENITTWSKMEYSRQ